MRDKPSSLFFDTNDYELLRIVNEVLNRGSKSRMLRSLLVEHMHPHGIKEMAAPRGLRIAYAIASLLGSLEQGLASDRIKALRSLRDEVILSSPTFYQKNTARVLLQIMKELLRCSDNELRQLKLAHDFRIVSTGNPRKVRAELAKYHLLEMPEEWNQFAFDDHVHDANTKGRKSPTHLVMDAWIKGIRHLTVVYYNYVRPEVVQELVEASEILDIRVQVGIEMSSRFRDKYVRFTWEPHGFNDNSAFLKFLEEESTITLMNEGRQVSNYQQRYVFEALECFNANHLETISSEYGLSLNPLSKKEFLTFVGVGQPSLLHLARFIQNALVSTIQLTQQSHDESDATETTDRGQSTFLERLKKLTIENIIYDFLRPSRNPELNDPSIPSDSHDVPELLRLKPEELLSRLLSLHSSSRFTLNLSNLSIQDTLEVLYNCGGMITHLESYNLKSAAHGITSGVVTGRGDVLGEVVDLQSPDRHYSLISDLQIALSNDNVIILKRVIRAIIYDHDEQYHRLQRHAELITDDSDGNATQFNDELHQLTQQKQQLMDILYNLETFHNYYKKRTLRSRVGSGSTGQAEHRHGMGLVVLETLPVRARRSVRAAIARHDRDLIPVTALLTKNSHKRCHDSSALLEKSDHYHQLTFFRSAADRKWFDWSLDGLIVHFRRRGNIATLGGLTRNGDLELPEASQKEKEKLGPPWKYLNTNMKNSLKVLFGFIPAFFTFYLTKDWWLLAWFGAVIWFGITGSRNIIQSVLGGGGLRRSPLLPWNSLISWSRISDSLLYTGFSVPLLDYLVKTLLLDQALGITTTTNPILLYSVMGLANGLYISSHNILRGLPKAASVGNLFRSILAIPIAIVLNAIIGAVLSATGVPDSAGILQKWAAIISKFASDCVAAVIEGFADRHANIKSRRAFYKTKISQLFAVFSRLDLQFPEEDVLEMLESPKTIMQTLNYEARDQERLIIVNALDLMYFWMYKPRARKALRQIMQNMSREEWLIFYRSQLVLKRYKEISQFFVDGLVGKNFSKPLAFYLDRSEEYLEDLQALERSRTWTA